jgi:hypothetical protein
VISVPGLGREHTGTLPTPHPHLALGQPTFWAGPPFLAFLGVSMPC